MIVHVKLLLFGLLLLWFPRQWMRLGTSVGGRRRRSSSPRPSQESWERPDAGNPRISFQREFSKFRNYFDLLRAIAGGLAIIGSAQVPPSIAVADTGEAASPWLVFGIKVGILFAGVLIQTMRVERHRFNFFAPVFYLAGLSVSLCTDWGALFAFVLIWAFHPMLGNAQAFLTVYSLTMAAFGLFLHEMDARLPVVAFLLCFTPVLLSLLARRPLVVYSRKAAHAAAGET